MIEIQVRKRSDDYHAQLGDNPKLWGCGRTANEAIGDVVLSHCDRLGFTVRLVLDSAAPASPATPEKGETR